MFQSAKDNTLLAFNWRKERGF